uniref:MADS-box transcription factor PHERES 2 n=1 Tax=Aegilops tauschii TaxID=37682 RepID=N1QV15_AEGTA
MARKKVTLIANDSTRRGSLMKKATELATMCDVKTCVVVYGEGLAEPKEAFLTQRIAKLRDQVDRARRECQDSEIRYLLYNIMHGNHPGLVDLSAEELARVGWKVDELLKSLGERMAKNHVQAPPPAPCVSTDNIDMGSPPLYLASPQEEEVWLDTVSSGGDVGTQVYGGNASHDTDVDFLELRLIDTLYPYPSI